MADKRQRILNYLETVESATLSELIEKCSLHYFANTNKHAGEILSRLVNCGKVNRVKNGTFSINKEYSPNKAEEDPDQMILFEV